MNRTHSSETRQKAFTDKSGFTLVEILAATGIMLVIILLVLTLTTNVLSSWTRSSSQLQTNFEARVALDLLTSDLESVVMRSRPIAWIQVEYDTIPLVGEVPILYFFAPALERPKKKFDGEIIRGDVCAISYRLAYKNPFTDNETRGSPNRKGDEPIFGLYRSVVDAESTFNEALSIADYKSGTAGFSLADYWNGIAISSDGSNIASIATDESGKLVPAESEFTFEQWITSSGNFLSQNVANFELTFWYDNGSGTLIDIPPGTPFVYAGELYLDGNSTSTPGDLVYVDVALTVLSSEGAKLIDSDTDPDGFSDNTPLGIREQYGQVFTRRINLMSSGF